MKELFSTRKPIRLVHYDYSQCGRYFLTICTYKHNCILSEIVSSNSVGAIHESPENKLTNYGLYADKIIENLENKYDIQIENYVIMPNHIHMLITIKYDERAIRESPLQDKRSIIDKLVGYLKMNLSKQIHKENPGLKIWQRSYFDHIIRNDNDFYNAWKYIDTNVIKWVYDKYYR